MASSIYVKIVGWQLETPAEMDRMFDELRATPQLRGIKAVILWGRYEKRDTNTGISRYDFSQIDQILARLSALDDKYLIPFPGASFSQTMEHPRYYLMICRAVISGMLIRTGPILNTII